MDLIERDKILEIAKRVAELPPADCPINQYFAPGIYVREMFIPAGVVAVGHHHKHEHLCSLIKGRMAFLKDGGYEIAEAPMTFLAQPGSKVVFAFEDSVVQNIHPNPDNIRDESELEKIFIEKLPIKERITCHGELLQAQQLPPSAV